MKELNFIEDNGLFGITFKSDNKEEANTVMNAIQRFISKNSNINNLDVNEYSNSIRKKNYMENIDSLLDSIEKIKKRRDLSELTYYELEYIALMEKEIVVMKEKLSMDKYTETAQPILNKMLETFTMDDLEKLKETTILDKIYIEKEIQKRLDNKSYIKDYSEKILEDDNGIISFGEDDSNYRIDEEDEEDPLSVDADNINRWDYDSDGDKVDSEGNKMLFDY